jgi:hypothetical protein
MIAFFLTHFPIDALRKLGYLGSCTKMDLLPACQIGLVTLVKCGEGGECEADSFGKMAAMLIDKIVTDKILIDKEVIDAEMGACVDTLSLHDRFGRHWGWLAGCDGEAALCSGSNASKP